MGSGPTWLTGRRLRVALLALVADTFVGDLAGFDDFKSFEPDAEQVRTYDTHFEFRLPAGQRLN